MQKTALFYNTGAFTRFFKNTDVKSGQVNGIFEIDDGETCIVSGKFDPAVTCVGIGDRLSVALADRGCEFKGLAQYQAKHICNYQSRDEIIKWLCSKDFKGVGPSNANKLIRWVEDRMGDAACLRSVVMCDPQMLEDAGVPQGVLNTICAVMSSGQLTKAAVKARFPSLTWEMADTMTTVLGDKFWTIVYSDPYRLLEIFEDECWATFNRIDKIGLSVGVKPEDPVRINAGVYHIVKADITGRGDTRIPIDPGCAEYESLIFRILRELGLGWGYKAVVEQALCDEMAEGMRLVSVTENGRQYCYVKYLMDAERRAARGILTMLAKGPLFQLGRDVLLAKMDEYEQATGFKLDSDQIVAVVLSMTRRVSVITGGPGRGKTAVMACMAYIWSTCGLDEYKVMPMAPTWLAAHRIDDALKPIAPMVKDYRAKDNKNHLYMTEDLRRAEAIARTIAVAKTKREKLGNDSEWDAWLYENYRGLAFIDESSMADVSQLAKLLEIFKYSQIVFLGDEEQLPSIGPGDVLRTMCASDRVPTAVLRVNHRTNRFAVLGDNADLIRKGTGMAGLDWSSDLFRMQAFDHELAGTQADPEDMRDYIVERYLHYVQDAVSSGGGMKDVCVLCAYSKAKHGPCGAENLNLSIQDAVNPANHLTANQASGGCERIYRDDAWHGMPMKFVQYAGRGIRLGDRVMYRRNLISKGITNGDCGIVKEYGTGTGPENPIGYVLVELDDGREIRLEGPEAESLQLAYAVTVHKSQGCEFKYVIFVASHKLMYDRLGFASRNLFYTAATRTKMQLEIVGYVGSIEKCIATPVTARECGFAGLLAKG